MTVTWAQRDSDHLVPPEAWEHMIDVVRDRYCLVMDVEERATSQALARLFELLAALRGT